MSGKGPGVGIASLSKAIELYKSYLLCFYCLNDSSCVSSLPPAAQDREQLKMELQQVNQQITQQTRYMEVSSLEN